jgi:hypothetical protein
MIDLDDGPPEIFLEPACCASQPEGRCWCEHDAPADCPEGTSWTRYVRADLYDALRAAAGKVTCRRCNGHGDLLQPDTVPPGWRTDPCPDCADLRALLAAREEKP